MATSNPAPIQTGSGTVLTVGAGMEFATLSDACKAAVAGDTIAVQAGTYVNDFATVTCALRIVSLGGMVNEVATVPPPDDKGLLTVNASLSIQGFSFTGGADNSPDGNVAGIRLQDGSLAVSYCYFHDMQEGLLADPDPTATVTVDHSEFARNGAGDGYSHNLYVGAVASLTVTNSYFTAANVGHEIKSRAAVTTITNNVITDGPTGTGSYDIDIPNAGVATITGNLIEKGPDASNDYAIHFGGETQYAYAKNALTITGNTILNDLGASGVAVLNQSNVNGLDTPAVIARNSFYGFDPQHLLLGAGTLGANTTLATEPAYSTAAPYAAVPDLVLAAGPQLLLLSNGNHVITGGSTAHLTVDDTGGSNTITGGAGGLSVTDTAGWDLVTTQAGASDSVVLANRNATVHSAGADHIAAPGFYEEVDATGAATITGAGFNTYDLDGAGEHLTASGGGLIAVAAAGAATITGVGGDYLFSEAAGGHAVISDQAAAAANDGSVSVTGAATGSIGGNGAVSLTLGDPGATVQAGNGSVSVTCGGGADSLTAGAGGDAFTLGSGADRVTFGAGAATVTAGSGTDTYVLQAGQHGTETINGFRPGVDVLSYRGFAGAAVASGTLSGDSTILTLADGTTVTFTGVALPGYAAPPPGPPSPPPTAPAPGTPPAAASGGIVLGSGGHALAGGAAVLAVTDLAGGNTVQGGAGGLVLMAADADLVGTAAGAADQVTLARYDTLSGAGTDQVTVAGAGNRISESGAATLSLLGAGNAVQGGVGLLSVSDAVGGDTVAGGSGGLHATLSGQYDSVSTAQDAADTVGLSGQSVLLSQGRDQVSVAGLYNQVTATGAATISASLGFSSFVLDGADSLASAGGGLVTVGGAASVTIASSGLQDLAVTKLAGGSAFVSESLPGGVASLTVGGGAATISALTGAYPGLDASLGGGVTLAAGTGNMTLAGGAGHDAFTGGSGLVTISLGEADTVSLGAGTLIAQGGAADQFVVPDGAQGTLVIANWSADDTLVTPGQAAPAVAAQSVSGGSDWLSFTGGAQVELVGVAHVI